MAGGKLENGIIKSGGAHVDGWVNNIDVKLDSGRFSIVPVEGSVFSQSNPGYITFSTADGSQNPDLITIPITGNNYFFDDASASSDIIGQEFGVTSGVAWSENRPFYLYAVNSDNTSSGVEFAISPNPALRFSPNSINTAFHGNPASTPNDNNFFYLTSTDVTSTHAVKPCVRIGGIRMKMSASDDWTVTPFNRLFGEGITKTPFEGECWNMVLGQNGAASGKFTLDNGGTGPTYTADNTYKYRVNFNGTVDIYFSLKNTSGGTAGAGAVNYLLVLPYLVGNFDSEYFTGTVYLANASNTYIGMPQIAKNLKYINQILYTSAINSTLVWQYAQQTNASRNVIGSLSYRVFI